MTFKHLIFFASLVLNIFLAPSWQSCFEGRLLVNSETCLVSKKKKKEKRVITRFGEDGDIIALIKEN